MSEIMKHSEIIRYSELLFRKKKIELKEYNMLENNCYICLSKINKKIELCVNMFNTLIQDISSLLSREFPNDVILKTYYAIVGNIISKNPIEPISSFIINVYSNDIYRKCILNGDEKFFLNTSYTTDKNDRLQMIFQLKSCWKKLNPDNRHYIKNAMSMLVELTKQYIEEKDDGNKLTKVIERIVSVKKFMNSQ
jgi:hypothetical protein